MSPIDLLDAAEVERRIQGWRDGHPSFDALLTRYGDRPRTLRHFGLTLWAERALDRAIEVFVTALSIERQDARLWVDLAGVLNAAARNLEAKTAIAAALALDPAQANAWLLQATLLGDLEEFDAAEGSFARAIALDPGLADAHFGLGILRFNQKRFAPAAESLRRSIECGNRTSNAFTCLGHVLYLLADFGGCTAAFEAAAALQPLDAISRRKYARARMMLVLIEGRIPEGLALYGAIAGDQAEERREVTRDAFSLLSANGHLEAAAAVGAMRLDENPEDFVQRYLLDAVRGVPIRTAPEDYLETLFDKFAPGFDRQLVGTLRYNVPETLSALLGAEQARFTDMLDLGCGTGLAARHLKHFGGRLTGVDLSARMLEEAAKRSSYDALIKAEAVAFLTAHPAAFDLIFAADMLVYVGDLTILIERAAAALRPGGIFAVSVEAAETGDYVLRPSGRFAHTRSYLERLAAGTFTLAAITPSILRIEGNRDVSGLLALLRRR